LYFDTATPLKPTIGIGFNLRDDAVRTAVLQAMEIDVNLIPAANLAARAAEQGYINQLTDKLKPSSGLYPTLVTLQVELDDILIARRLDPLLSGFAHIATTACLTWTRRRYRQPSPPLFRSMKTE
jgi:hypothetical protein